VVLFYKQTFKVIGVKAHHAEAGHLTVLFCPFILFFGGRKPVMLHT
jgi:hypothetical protein